MFHPNVRYKHPFQETYSLHLDILQKNWSPAYHMSFILTSIWDILREPELESPVNKIAADMYRYNFKNYKKRVSECVKKSLVEQD